MAEQMPDILLRIRHRGPVRRIVDPVVALPQLVEARHIGGHVAIGRDDHGRRPAHHMIAGEQRAVIGEAEMVRRVARRCDGGERLAVHLEHFAIGEHSSGT